VLLSWWRPLGRRYPVVGADPPLSTHAGKNPRGSPAGVFCRPGRQGGEVAHRVAVVLAGRPRLSLQRGQSSPRTVAFQGGSVSVEETKYFDNSLSLSVNSPSAVGQKACMASYVTRPSRSASEFCAVRDCSVRRDAVGGGRPSARWCGGWGFASRASAQSRTQSLQIATLRGPSEHRVVVGMHQVQPARTSKVRGWSTCTKSSGMTERSSARLSGVRGR
jgi:hypothetical protein